MTDKELQRLLKSNPDLVALDDRGREITHSLDDVKAFAEAVVEGKVKRHVGLSEFHLQATVFAEIDVRACLDPRWGLIAAVPNGQYRDGQRMEPGLRKGFPDIIWPLARLATHDHPAYHGMVMELKVGDNNTEPEQMSWLHRLAQQGWYTCIRRDDPTLIIQTFEWYLEGCQ